VASLPARDRILATHGLPVLIHIKALVRGPCTIAASSNAGMDCMATRRQSSTFHLTRNGWIVGDDPPAGRVESWTCVVEQAGRSKRYVEWTCLWADPDVTQMERDRLRQQFEQPVSGWPQVVA